MADPLLFSVTFPKGTVDLVEKEFNAFGIPVVKQTPTSIEFQGQLEQAYKICLWSRLCTRVLLQLGEFVIKDENDLYRKVSEIDWSEHMNQDGSLAVSCNIIDGVINNSHYASLKTKDAIVDQFVAKYQQRPSVEKDMPDVRINVFIKQQQLKLSIDLSGNSLHKRGYRSGHIKAPLKENLAAAILMRAGWPGDYTRLVDPMCGSGTFLTEAAQMALGIAPGLGRAYYGFNQWKQHDVSSWGQLLKQAQAEADAAQQSEQDLKIQGYDESHSSVNATRKNIQATGLAKWISVDTHTIKECVNPFPDHTGLLLSNPPYGERLGDVKQLAYVYDDMGLCFKRHFPGWSAAVFSGNPELARNIGLRSHKENTLFNGAIRCKLYQYRINATPLAETMKGDDERDVDETLLNRLKKNLKHLGRWAQKNQVECYRLYDADIPEFSAAIDLYGERVHIQEYAPPADIEVRKSRKRLRQIINSVASLLQLDRENIVVKTRARQKGQQQYEKQAETGHFFVVREAGLKFRVNLEDYLDTGLFLDHRLTRAHVRDLAAGKSVLNLFAYTGSVSVYAADGKASAVMTVDMSRTYLDWARENLRLNGFKGEQYQFVQADCLQWLEKQSEKYDLIFLDPPTFSNSKRMDTTFDVQRDHEGLIQMCISLLNPGGLVLFSNNFRRFKLEPGLMELFDVKDISRQTIPEDFKRNTRIHQCWEIRHK